VPIKITDRFDFRTLLRLAAWGAAASMALALTVIAAQSNVGSKRLALAFSTARGASATQTAQLNSEAVARAKAAEDLQRLSESMRGLASDRDRLLARVTVIERNLEDVTGSIAHTASAPSTGTRQEAGSDPSSPTPQAAAPLSTLAGPTTLATAAAVSSIPSAPIAPSASFRIPFAPAKAVTANETVATIATPETGPAASIGTRSEFGVDIGGGTNLEELRDLWTSARANHGPSLEGLRPVVGIRDGAKSGGLELRLIVGPLHNAGAAARICANLAASGWSCKPALFDGQRLALR
jgi:hypothetical protein